MKPDFAEEKDGRENRETENQAAVQITLHA
jgi:hypothetical protein